MKVKGKKEVKKSHLIGNALIIGFVLMLILVIFTRYYGSMDIGDYSNSAKFFAGELNGKLRISHSVTYGMMHAPFVKLTQSFVFMKISSVLWLFLIVLSVYYISKRNKKTFFLMLTTPIIWYMAPWINPLQLASLIFLWTYFFMLKYNEKGKLKHLFYSGLLAGFSGIFWEPTLYFAVILMFCYLYDKKFSHFILFFIALGIGTVPKLIIDQIFFGFAFYSIFKHIFAEIAFVFFEGAYGQVVGFKVGSNFLIFIFILLFFPFYSYLLFSKKNFSENKKTIIFLILSFILVFLNFQIRAVLILVPIIVLMLGDILNNKQFKIQIAIFLIISLITINPYLLQIKYQTNGNEFGSFIMNLPNLELNSSFYEDEVNKDIIKITKDYPNKVFIVGNQNEDYQKLGEIYWGEGIKEFISIEDYKLSLQGKSIIAEKTICSSSKPWNRRDICMSVDLRKMMNDQTDYESIQYAISLEKDLDLEGFKLVKRYDILSVYEKEA